MSCERYLVSHRHTMYEIHIQDYLLNTQGNHFISATHHILSLEPHKVVLKPTHGANTANRLSLRSNALHLAIARDIALKGLTAREARVAMEHAKQEVLVVLDPGIESRKSAETAEAAKRAIGVESEV